MLKQILCCSLLIGQLCAGELPWPSFPGGANGGVTGMMVMPNADQTDYFHTFEEDDADTGPFLDQNDDAQINFSDGYFAMDDEMWSNSPMDLEATGPFNEIATPAPQERSAISFGFGPMPQGTGMSFFGLYPGQIEVGDQMIQGGGAVVLERKVALEVPVPQAQAVSTAKRVRHFPRKYKFSKENDKKIIEFAEESMGRQGWIEWSKSKEKCGLRQNLLDIKGRYYSFLEFRSSECPEFTKEFDAWLLKKVNEMGHKWRDISSSWFVRSLSGKDHCTYSASQVKNRWRHLQRCPALLEHYNADPEE